MYIRHFALYPRRLNRHASQLFATEKEEALSVLPQTKSTIDPRTLFDIPTALEKHSLPDVWTLVDLKLPAPEGHTALYSMKCPTAYGEHDSIMGADGTLRMFHLSSLPSANFSVNEYAWYWIRERAIAEKYPEWIASRSKLSETWLIRKLVPNTYLRDVSKEQLIFPQKWKEHVGLCRNFKRLPEKFDSLLMGWKAADEFGRNTSGNVFIDVHAPTLADK